MKSSTCLWKWTVGGKSRRSKTMKSELPIICYLKLSSQGVVPRYQVLLIFWPKMWKPSLLSLSFTFHFQSIRKSCWLCFQNVSRCGRFSSLALSLVKGAVTSSRGYSNKPLTGRSPRFPTDLLCGSQGVSNGSSEDNLQPSTLRERPSHWVKGQVQNSRVALHNLFPHTYTTTSPPGEPLTRLMVSYSLSHSLSSSHTSLAMAQTSHACSVFYLRVLTLAGPSALFLLMLGSVNFAYPLHVCSKVPSQWIWSPVPEL